MKIGFMKPCRETTGKKIGNLFFSAASATLRGPVPFEKVMVAALRAVHAV
jgi:hypothetical protein